MGVDRTTINRHYNAYKACKDFETYLSTHYKPCVGKLSEEQLATVATYVADNLCNESLHVRDFIKETFRSLEDSLPQDEVILFAAGVHPQHNTEASYAWIAKDKSKKFYPIQAEPG